MAGIAAQFEINQTEKDILHKILHAKTLGVVLQQRAQIVLAASEKLTNLQIQAQYGFEEHRVATWRTRFRDQYEAWKHSRPTSGRPCPKNWSSNGWPIEKDVEINRPSPPHKSQYYLKSADKEKDPVKFEQDVKKVCDTYRMAKENEYNGIHTVSVDEKTGIQALERDAPNKPMIPGYVENREYNYQRHGTTCLFGHLPCRRMVLPHRYDTSEQRERYDAIRAEARDAWTAGPLRKI